MSPVGFGLIIIVTFLSAVIATVFGVAGGSILFVSLSFLLSSKEAIPLHGLIQLLNNGIRSFVFLKSIHWKIVGLFGLFSIPGAMVGGMFYDSVSNEILEFAIGTMILFTNHLPVFRPGKIPAWLISAFGFFTALLGMIAGVTGPVLTTFLAAGGLTKERLVATKSMCQVVAQFAKTLIFLRFTGFDFYPYWDLIGLIALISVVGVYTAKFLFRAISKPAYDRYLKLILDGVAFVMMGKALSQW